MPLELRAAEDAECDFAFRAKRDAIRPHVVVRWEWDDAWQLEHHRRRWQSKPWQIICLDSVRIGTVSIDVQSSHLQFGEFYVLQGWRNRGWGSEVLRRALAIADDKRLETRLEYLKWNPVASLYINVMVSQSTRKMKLTTFSGVRQSRSGRDIHPDASMRGFYSASRVAARRSTKFVWPA